MSQASTRNTRGIVALALVVVFVLGAAASAVLAFRLSNESDALEVSRVKAVSEQFALRMDSLSSKDIPGYVDNVAEVLTTRCKADFEKSEAALTGSIGTVGFTTKGFIRATGVSTIDDDSATVMVVHDAEKTAESGQSLLSAYRWTISLRKVNGTWLVDKFLDPDRGGEAC